MVASLPLLAYHFGVLEKALRYPEFILTMLVGGAGFLLTAWVRWRHGDSMRLTVDDAGVRMRSTAPAWRGLSPWASWDLRWEDVSDVVVMERFGIVNMKRTRMRGLALRVGDWIDDTPVAEWTAESAPALKGARSTPLWRALDEAGLFARARRGARSDAVSFDLFGHPGTRAAVVVAAVLIAYAAVDSIVATEAWIEWSAPYLMPHVGAGLFVAGFVAVALLRPHPAHPVPHIVAVVIAVTVGASVAMASWHALIRINQAFGGPLVDHPYVRNQGCTALVPVDARLPQIEYSDLAREYWCTFPQDYLHVVPVRRGIGGLYQVDLTAHTRAIRQFRDGPRRT